MNTDKQSGQVIEGQPEKYELSNQKEMQLRFRNRDESVDLQISLA